MSLKNCGGLLTTEDNSWFSHQNSLAILPAEPSGSKQEKRAKNIFDLALRSIFCSYLSSNFSHGVQSYDMGPTALLPLQRKACCRFYRP
jgi:hypothetical protein